MRLELLEEKKGQTEMLDIVGGGTPPGGGAGG